ncbi:MAG: hypothetical protein EXS12_08970 [Phycisphaerales bacterium]|nr:hypothetical protein [Phycisphaerales bacterium]
MTKPTLILDRMQFFGRLAADYQTMFGVTLESLKGKRVLDCPAGPSSFVAQACAAGVDAVGVDPLYAHGAHELRQRCQDDIAYTVQRMAAHEGAYSDLNLQAYADNKRAALELFLPDYEADRAGVRYINASLPTLPFANDEFDHTFSAHLLVTYSDPASGGILPNSPFTLEWHMAAVFALMRVTRGSLHVYPTTTRTLPARRHPYIEAIVARIEAQNVRGHDACHGNGDTMGVWKCRYEPSTYQRGDMAQNYLNASLVIERQPL